MEKQIPATVDEYIAGFPPEIQSRMREMRAAIHEAAPEAAEKISWGMATFDYYGNLVHFSAEKKHMGFHPAPSAIEAFRAELAEFRCSKGTVQLPYEKPLPLELVQKMVRFRVAEQEALHEARKEKKPLTQERLERARHPMPEEVEAALQQEGLRDAYDARPPYQRNDYIGWISRAKRPETRGKRLEQMLDELRAGDIYMGMRYGGRRKQQKKAK